MITTLEQLGHAAAEVTRYTNSMLTLMHRIYLECEFQPV